LQDFGQTNFTVMETTQVILLNWFIVTNVKVLV